MHKLDSLVIVNRTEMLILRELISWEGEKPFQKIRIRSSINPEVCYKVTHAMAKMRKAQGEGVRYTGRKGNVDFPWVGRLPHWLGKA